MYLAWQSNNDPKYLAVKHLIEPDAADAKLGDVDLDDGGRTRGRSRSREPEELPQPELEPTPPALPGRPWDAPAAFGPSQDSDIYKDDDDDGRWNPEAHQHEPDSPQYSPTSAASSPLDMADVEDEPMLDTLMSLGVTEATARGSLVGREAMEEEQAGVINDVNKAAGTIPIDSG